VSLLRYPISEPSRQPHHRRILPPLIGPLLAHSPLIQAEQHCPQHSTQPLSQCSRVPTGLPSGSRMVVTQHSSQPGSHLPSQLQNPPGQQKPGSLVLGFGGQDTPQRPHDSQSPSPSQSTVPDGHVHVRLLTVPLHSLGASGFSGLGQSKNSHSRFVGGPVQMVPQNSGSWQMPFRHVPLAHAVVQLPQ
jgi:hypothetical protein